MKNSTNFILKDLISSSAWRDMIFSALDSSHVEKLEKYLQLEYRDYEIYPAQSDIFKAINTLEIDRVKCIILGQDPYHGKGEAHGLSFSVPEKIKIPPSLRNILKELESDLGFKSTKCGDLTKWSREGVLLLNTVLTVRADTPLSHRHLGWEMITQKIIELVAQHPTPKVFMAFGSHAHQCVKNIDRTHHCVIETVHPSPLAAYRGFFGSRPFSRCNEFLISRKLSEIDFNLN